MCLGLFWLFDCAVLIIDLWLGILWCWCVYYFVLLGA